jgi:hypothetical protein
MERGMSKFTVFFAGCLIFLCGCSGIKETVKGFAGVSTKILEEGRKEAVSRQFNYGYKSCYDLVKASLENGGSHIYAEDPRKRMIAVYLSQEDTSPVGVFFIEIGALNTQVEVSSPSTYAKELILNRIIASLEKKGLENEKK